MISCTGYVYNEFCVPFLYMPSRDLGVDQVSRGQDPDELIGSVTMRQRATMADIAREALTDPATLRRANRAEALLIAGVSVTSAFGTAALLGLAIVLGRHGVSRRS